MVSKQLIVVSCWLGVVCTLETTCPYFTSSHDSPLIIAHRGACGYLPEHSLAGYSEAFYMGADFVEPDVVITKDHQLVCVHDLYLSDVTDVASHPEFADRKRKLTLGGKERDDWWTIDFTLTELKTLRLHQRWPDRNHFYDGLFQIPTLEEALDLLTSLNESRKKENPKASLTGAYIEMKWPDFLKEQGFDVNQLAYNTLKAHGIETCAGAAATVPIIMQDFFESTLDFFHDHTDLPLIFLGEEHPLSYMATKAHGVGPSIDSLVSSQDPWTPNDYVSDAHKLGLKVHPWTLRQDQPKYGSTVCEKNMNMLSLNIDGLFTEYPDGADFFWATKGCNTQRRSLSQIFYDVLKRVYTTVNQKTWSKFQQ